MSIYSIHRLKTRYELNKRIWPNGPRRAIVEHKARTKRPTWPPIVKVARGKLREAR